MANTATGVSALEHNITGTLNTAIGSNALLSNRSGSENMAAGGNALRNNSAGRQNTAIGAKALYDNTAQNNTAIGYQALYNSTSGDRSVAVGAFAGGNVVTASNVICIGAEGADASDTTWLGNVYGVTTQSGTTAPVVVSADGQLGTIASSQRFKKDIAPIEKASETILSLRPVTFHYKSDANGTPQFGLIAEEVAKVNPALVVPDKGGKPYTVRYEAVNAMLLNEFLKEHKTVQELKSIVVKQEAIAAQQQKQIETLTAGLQKVSAQLEVSKAAPQTVLNNQ